jgi:hypothetical protein
VSCLEREMIMYMLRRTSVGLTQLQRVMEVLGEWIVERPGHLRCPDIQKYESDT